MIQFNLLPDVKLEYIKANRLKRVVTVVSALVASVALLVFVLLFLSVNVVQKHHMKSLNNQITSVSTKLKDLPNLNEVLTVQNGVNALPSLYAQDPAITRLPGYISQLTPASATISDLNLSFTANTISISGAAPDLTTVNQFVDILKLSKYQTSSSSPSENAFSDVILSSFSYSSTSGSIYTITASFDPTIFNASDNNVTLIVPNGITSHSTSTQNGVLFQQESSSNTTTGQ